MPKVGVPEFDQLLDHRHGVFAGRRRIAGAVREEDAVGLERHDIFRRGLRRHYCDLAAGAGEQAQNIALDAVVERDHVEFRIGLPRIAFVPGPRRLVPGKALRACHHGHQVHADEAGPILRLFLERGHVELARWLVRDHCVRHAFDADQRGERARVDAGKPDDAARLQPIVEVFGRPVVRGLRDRAV